MSVKVFVSGKYAEKPLIKSKMIELENLGYFITHDWTTHPESPISNNEHQLLATFDIEGIRKCDVQIVIISDADYPYRGTFCEMGCAMGLNKRIFIFNPLEDALCTNVPFYYHGCVSHFDTWDGLLIELNKIKQQKDKLYGIYFDNHQLEYSDEYDT